MAYHNSIRLSILVSPGVFNFAILNTGLY